MDVTGMNAVVTGGLGGLGTSIANRLIEAGADVVATDIAAVSGSTLRQRAGTRVVHHDVGDRDSWDSVARYARQELGGIDLLVNNAGIGVRKDLLTTTDEDWDRVLRTNLWGPWTGVRVFADDLAESDCGSVVNIGSIYGARVPPGSPAPPSSVAYQVSKAGLHMLTRTAAVELAPRGIRVNAVLPGVFVTPLLADLTEDQLEPRISQAPLARPGVGADVAEAVLYLASRQAKFVTAVLLPVDGGASGT